MEPVNKQEFLDWRENAVTSKVMLEISQRVAAIRNALEGQAGEDNLRDRFLAGQARAYRNILEIEFDDVGDSDESV